MGSAVSAFGKLAGSLAGGVLLVTPLAAQDPQEQPTENERAIVVEGRLEIDGVEAREQARDITNRRGSTSRPLARFNTPICPGVWGLMPENAQLVIDRIYENAERAGVRTNATEDCRANMWVIFVDDPHETYREMRSEGAFLLNGINIWQSRRILEQEGPALAWASTSETVENGVTAADTDSQVNELTSMSRLDTGVRNDIEVAVVLIDRSVLGELDAYSLADYATMRLLAETRPPESDEGFDTILTLFDGDGVDDLAPTRLSDFDIAYLRSLYRGSGTRPSTRAHASLDELMLEELQRE